MNYQLCLYCPVSLTFFWIMLGIFRWLQIILVCNFKCILGYFVKWLFLVIFVFCLFLVCRTFEFDRNFHMLGFGSFKAYFVELTFVKLSSKFHLDPLRLDRSTVFSLGVIYLNDKSAPFGELKLLLVFSLHSILPAALISL